MAHGHPATLTGLAIGDALGMPFEMDHFTSERLMGWNGDYWPCAENHPFLNGLAAGQWTDDTKMARALSESLAEDRTFNPGDIARRYLAWFNSGDLRGIGSTTSKALTNLKQQKPWTNTGVIGSEGNGTAMRIAPLGLFYRNWPTAVAKMARLDATITHDSDAAREGSVAVAVAIALMVGKQYPKAKLIPALLDILQPGQIELRLRGTKAKVNRASQSIEAAYSVLTEMGAGGHVVETVPAAFLAFLATNTFADAVKIAIMAGGDTDTTAAITGALAGSFYGIDGIDGYYKKHLEDFDQLHGLERELYGRSPINYEEAR